MRVHRNAIAPLILLIAAAATPAVSQTPSLNGTYRYVPEESDAIKPAIERAVARMNFITRPIARGRLTKTNNPYQTLSLNESNGQVTVVTDQRAPIVSPADGTPVKWTREDGEVFDVTTKRVGGALEQTFIADDGQRKNIYSLSPDGNTLEMQVTVTSPRLAEAVTYTLRYRRES